MQTTAPPAKTTRTIKYQQIPYSRKNKRNANTYPGIVLKVCDKRSGEFLHWREYEATVNTSKVTAEPFASDAVPKGTQLKRPDDAEKMRQIFVDVAKGSLSSGNQVAFALNDRCGFTTRTKKRYDATEARKLLRNDLYVEVNVVSQTVFDDANRLLKTNKTFKRAGHRVKPGFWLLKRLLWCGHCEKQRMRCAPDKTHNCHRYGTPRDAGADPNCPHPSVQQDTIEGCVLRLVRELVREKGLWTDAEINLSAEKQPDRAKLERLLATLIDRILLWADPKEIGHANVRRLRAVIHFKDSEKNKSVPISHEEIYAELDEFRAIEAVRKARGGLRLCEISQAIGKKTATGARGGVLAAERDGYLRLAIGEITDNRSNGRYVICKPPTPTKLAASVAPGKRTVVRDTPTAKAAARRTRGSVSRKNGKAGQADTVQVPAEVQPFPGLAVDEQKKTISRANGKSVDLRGSVVEWHIFFRHYQANDKPVTPSDLKTDYPGEWGQDGGSMRVARNHLNGRLAKLGFEIRNGLLRNRAAR